MGWPLWRVRVVVTASPEEWRQPSPAPAGLFLYRLLTLWRHDSASGETPRPILSKRTAPAADQRTAHRMSPVADAIARQSPVSASIKRATTGAPMQTRDSQHDIRRERNQFRRVLAISVDIPAAPQRTSIRTLRPSTQPNCCRPCTNAVSRA